MMKFKVKGGQGFNDEGIIHNDPVVGYRLNGYIVNHDGEEYFIPFCLIDVIEISKEEKNVPTRWD